MSLAAQIKERTAKTISTLFNVELAAADILVNQTKPEFEGEYTVVLFALVKQLRKSPEQLGKEIGEALVRGNPDLFTGFNVIKGFLNLSVSDAYYTGFLNRVQAQEKPAPFSPTGKKIIVEYSSPNTNKPLHLGHLRN
ncbi:MAG TPA: arginine--tRNA ligase, partial [Flavisolibacter sp.]